MGRGYKVDNDLMHLEVSEWICDPVEFTIKGKPADRDDFGDQGDFHDEGYDPDECEGGCYCMSFDTKPHSQEVLDKYGINVDEYNAIAEELAIGLSFGRCGLCM